MTPLSQWPVTVSSWYKRKQAAMLVVQMHMLSQALEKGSDQAPPGYIIGSTLSNYYHKYILS